MTTFENGWHNVLDTAAAGRLIAEMQWASDAEGRLWSIRPEVLLRLHNVLDDQELMRSAFARLEHLASSGSLEAPDEEDPEGGTAADRPGRRRRGRLPAIDGGVAVVPLKGVLMPGGMSLLEMIFGIKSGLSAFQDDFAAAMDDPDVGAIVIDTDSPGGLVDQIPETAAMVAAAAAGPKEIVAVSNTMAASAAYWIASQANAFYASPSSETGSIGVYATHMDNSKALENLGVKPTLVSAGKYKTEGNPYQPLEPEAEAAMQQAVDDYYNHFTKDVATGRQATQAEVKAGYGEGRVLTAKRAKEAKLVDDIKTIDEVVGSLTRRSTGMSTTAAFANAEDRARFADALWPSEVAAQ